MTANKMRTLVVGGAGYIGAHLVPQLIATGRRVTVLGRSGIPRYSLPIECKYICGDFGQLDLIKSLLESHDEVIHLAYASVPNTSFEQPLADLQGNLIPTVQLFSEAAQRRVKLVLVSSGGTIYGEAQVLPIGEDHPTKPISPYGVTKLTLENYAYLYAATQGLEFVCVRPANAYGVGQRPFTGQGFVATAMASAMKNLPIKIFGPKGTIRDYIYVTDLAAGIIAALIAGRHSETYNLGSCIGRSNLDVIQAFSPLIENAGQTVQIEKFKERAFDVKENVLDSSKLKAHTGWSSKIDFSAGLEMTYEWLNANK
jgi:UDP-glucose 4-epimerase